MFDQIDLNGVELLEDSGIEILMQIMIVYILHK
jgi:hypothetical protein